MFSVEGLVLAFATCFAIHVAMVPLGLDALAHEAGHGLSEMFAGAAADPSSLAAAPAPDLAAAAAPGADCHFHGAELHCGPEA